jgi:hypothetical protein
VGGLCIESAKWQAGLAICRRHSGRAARLFETIGRYDFTRLDKSKLIALWSSIEAQWGEEDEQDRLLSPEEYKRVKKALDFLPQGKYSRIIDQISKLKNKTRNDKIIKGISNLQCAREWDVKRTVRDIHALRSRFAHGNIMSPDDQARTERYVSTMLQIIDELITQKLAEYNIVFS